MPRIMQQIRKAQMPSLAIALALATASCSSSSNQPTEPDTANVPGPGECGFVPRPGSTYYYQIEGTFPGFGHTTYVFTDSVVSGSSPTDSTIHNVLLHHTHGMPALTAPYGADGDEWAYVHSSIDEGGWYLRLPVCSRTPTTSHSTYETITKPGLASEGGTTMNFSSNWTVEYLGEEPIQVGQESLACAHIRVTRDSTEEWHNNVWSSTSSGTVITNYWYARTAGAFAKIQNNTSLQQLLAYSLVK
ncbi:MAG: hypothetical protein JST22_02825 [Bacteroidetes bacterium]|nr:hypothetical protein [Bacteroidota bacterium]